MGDFDFLNHPDFGMQGGMRANTELQKGNLDALLTAGKIEAQPGERALTAAHTRAYAAEADVKEQAAAGERAMAAAMGQLEPGGEPLSPSAVLIKMGKVAGKAGLVTKMGDLFNKASEIDARELAGLTQQARASLMQTREQLLKVQQVGSLAASVVDQASLDRALTQAEQQGLDVQGIPRDFASAQPVLQQHFTSALKASDILHNKMERLKLDALEKRRSVENAKDAAYIAKSTVQRKILTQKYYDEVKNGGANSRAALEAKQAKTAADRALADARQMVAARDALPVPLDSNGRPDEKKMPPGKYMTPVGPRLWTGKGWVQAPSVPLDSSNDSSSEDADLMGDD